MTRLPDDISKEFPNLSPQQQQDLLTKLQRYVERGDWARRMLQALAPKAASPHDQQAFKNDGP